MNPDINWLAVALATISSMAVGAVWYSGSVFGNYWAKLAKIDMKRASKEAPKALTLALVLSFFTAFVLAHMIELAHAYHGSSYMKDAITTAWWIWLGFEATAILTHNAFEQKKFNLSILAIGNRLVTLMVMAVIFGLLK